MSIVTTQSYNPMGGFDAYDSETYDGAPDSSPLCRIMGWGKTRQAAIDDWIAQFDLMNDTIDGKHPMSTDNAAATSQQAHEKG